MSSNMTRRSFLAGLGLAGVAVAATGLVAGKASGYLQCRHCRAISALRALDDPCRGYCPNCGHTLSRLDIAWRGKTESLAIDGSRVGAVPFPSPEFVVQSPKPLVAMKNITFE